MEPGSRVNRSIRISEWHGGTQLGVCHVSGSNSLGRIEAPILVVRDSINRISLPLLQESLVCREEERRQRRRCYLCFSSPECLQVGLPLLFLVSSCEAFRNSIRLGIPSFLSHVARFFHLPHSSSSWVEVLSSKFSLIFPSSLIFISCSQEISSNDESHLVSNFSGA